MRVIDETGNRYGRLTVVERAEGIKGSAAWLCRCECGNEKIVLGILLRNGNTVSCGCKRAGVLSESNYKDEAGNKYGRLTVIGTAGQDGRQNYLWECQCECGNTHIVSGVLLRGGNTKSCGCYKAEWATLHKTTHGMAKKGRPHPLYRLWVGMKTRCYNDNEPCWDNYGGRGITVCQEWQTFEPFYEWAKGKYQRGLEIDRRDNNKGYSPDNCHFVTTKENMRNKRNNRHITIGGETKLLVEWAEETGIDRLTLYQRVKVGWGEGDLLAPVGKYHNMSNPRISTG